MIERLMVIATPLIVIAFIACGGVEEVTPSPEPATNTPLAGQQGGSSRALVNTAVTSAATPPPVSGDDAAIAYLTSLGTVDDRYIAALTALKDPKADWNDTGLVLIALADQLNQMKAPSCLMKVDEYVKERASAMQNAGRQILLAEAGQREYYDIALTNLETATTYNELIFDYINKNIRDLKC